MKINLELCFDDVLLMPGFSDVSSRDEITLETTLGSLLDKYKESNIHLELPIISSPMDTVTEDRMARSMDFHGGTGIIHRYNTIEEQVEIVKKSLMHDNAVVGAAIGAGKDSIERANALIEAGARFICIDIAHGDHILMKNALENLRKSIGNDIHIMAGNVATKEGFERLVDWGASSVRVGIGGGSICSTRIQTGHGRPTLASIFDCAMSSYDATIIADGGIKKSGDIVKALAAGADAVMLGSMLAGSDEAPGDVITVRGEKRKTYRGMASAAAQKDWRGYARSIEGVTSTVPCKGPVHDILNVLEVNIQSGLSYSGARDVEELQAKATFIRQTSAGVIESNPHILEKS